MSKEKMDQLMDHSYDGIQEYDNPMPKWWLYTFYGAIIFAALYLGYTISYEVTMQSLTEESNRRHWSTTALAVDIKKNTSADNVNWEEFQPEMLAELISADESLAKKGAAVFAGKCAPCHGSKAEGVVGPNLNDEFWIYGGKLANIYTSVKDGRPNGMPAWEKEIGKAKVVSLVAFINSIRGTKVAGAKAPQGEKYTGE